MEKSAHFAQRFLLARKNKGLSREQIAVLLSTSYKTIARWETGQSVPKSKGVLARIKQLLDITIAEKE